MSVSTSRYSKFFRELFQEYGQQSVAVIDGIPFDSSKYPELIDNWCINKSILNTKNFKLVRGNLELFGFHDHPDELWASYSELPFLEKLAAEKIIRFQVMNVDPKTSVF